MWIFMAGLSAFFAGLTAILAKCGLKNTDSDLATALRTVVVLAFAWLMTLLVGSWQELGAISGRSMLFLILSGLATGASWLCYFKALALCNVNQVTPVDKSSTVISVLLAIIILGETANLPLRLAACFLLALGVWLMLERKAEPQRRQKGNAWLLYAMLSAIFAALTSILAKIGIAEVESNLGTAIRTLVVLVMAWGIVFGRSKQRLLANLNRRELLFLILSGLATGASWLCYYYAIQQGVVSVVVPVDKLSIVVTVIFSCLIFKERLSRRALLGLLLIIAGTLLMTLAG